MEKTWKDAIKRVLAEAETPLHYAEISEQILSRSYYSSEGATPAATVNAQIAASIKHDGEKSPFIRVGRGIFSLKTTTPPPLTQSGNSQTNKKNISAPAPNDETEPLIHAFGMYWQRERVIWRSEPKMYGQQQAQSKAVDFGKQKGIYILYDHHTVVYVGRSIDRPLGKRLFEHTVDRLAGRWNRFSWFGLLDVTQEGDLRERPLNSSLAGLVATLEALLIEALEPPQNRKRGDDFSAIEYIQGHDPELKDREIQTTLRAVEQKLREDY